MDPHTDRSARDKQPWRLGAWWGLFAAALAVVLIAILMPRPKPAENPGARAMDNQTTTVVGGDSRTRHPLRQRQHWQAEPGVSAEEAVARKLGEFARSRRDIINRMAEKANARVPPECEAFLAAMEAGRWDETDSLYKKLLEMRHSPEHAGEILAIWPAILETYGVAEVAHKWPAQQLLDYGSEVLGSLKPDAVYVGGTDPGRFIPTLLNETSSGERHIVLTQNALADGSYLEYLGFLYADRMNALTSEDSRESFTTYMTDAQARLEHDQKFPNEPKQVHPGENIQVNDGRVQISGQIAVMAINERLFQTLMDKNPDLSFAIEQSFPLTSTYSEATPLGPIMELRVRDERDALTPQRASETVDYWRTASQQILSDPQAMESTTVRQTYAKMAADQADLLLARNHPAEAEQTFRLAMDINPTTPDVVLRYVNLLAQQNRTGEALAVVNTALQSAPDNEQFRALADSLSRARMP